MPDSVQPSPKWARSEDLVAPTAIPGKTWKVDKVVNDTTKKAVSYLEKCLTRVGASAWWNTWEVVVVEDDVQSFYIYYSVL